MICFLGLISSLSHSRRWLELGSGDCERKLERYLSSPPVSWRGEGEPLRQGRQSQIHSGDRMPHPWETEKPQVKRVRHAHQCFRKKEERNSPSLENLFLVAQRVKTKQSGILLEAGIQSAPCSDVVRSWDSRLQKGRGKNLLSTLNNGVWNLGQHLSTAWPYLPEQCTRFFLKPNHSFVLYLPIDPLTQNTLWATHMLLLVTDRMYSHSPASESHSEAGSGSVCSVEGVPSTRIWVYTFQWWAPECV